MPPQPTVSPEDETGQTDEESADDEESTTEVDIPTSLAIVDWSSFFIQYDWSAWDERVATWYSNCDDVALTTPPLPFGARMHHCLEAEEWSSPFDELCPNLESIVIEDIQTWQVRVEEHVDAAGRRVFWTLIGNVIVHKLPVPTPFSPIDWICSLYEDDIPEWLFEDEDKTAEWFKVRDRSRIALLLTLVPMGQLSTYNTLMITLAEEERLRREEAQCDPTNFSFTRIDVSEKDVFFEFYNPLNVHLNLLTRGRLDAPWSLFGEVGKTSSLGYTTFTFPRQEENDPHFFRIIDANTDTDGDGLSDGLELNYFKSDPTKEDSKNSGLSDWEKVYVYGLSPNERDSDGDGLIDGEEIHIGTDPLKADTDNDGLTDSEESTCLQPAATFTWIPITSSIIEQRDGNIINIPLSTPIQISDNLYDKVVVHTNGSISLSNTLSNDANESILIKGHKNASYLSIDAESDILFEETRFNDVSCYVFSFMDLHFDYERTSQNSVTFQIVLSPSHPNRIWINYLKVGEDRWGEGTIAYIQHNATTQIAQFPKENNMTLKAQISLEGYFGSGTHPLNADSDNDELVDGIEIKQTKTSPLMVDTDEDGLSDGDEVNKYQTSPLNPDTDGDTLPDAWEILHGLNACSMEGEHGRFGDPDGDQLINSLEAQYQTSPYLVDTDDDGLSDLEECGCVTSKNAPFDSSLGTLIGALTSTSNRDSLSYTFELTDPLHTNVGTFSDLFISLDGCLLLFNKSQGDISDSFGTNASLTSFNVNSHAFLIAAYWDDLYYFANKTSIALYETEAEYFVHYKDVGFYNSKSNDSIVGSFIIRLPKDSKNPISISYSNFPPSFSFESATIGIRTQRLSYEVGQKVYQYAFNQSNVITNNTTLTFSIGTGTDPLVRDSDKDGLLDGEEVAQNTSSFNSDCDADGLPDGWEVKHQLNPLSALGEDGADGDCDNDWMRNCDEYQANTSPKNNDSDADGLLDSYEYGAIAFQSDSTWIMNPSGMTDITTQFSNASSGHVEIEITPISFLNMSYTTLSINLNGRIDLFHRDTPPSGLNSSVIKNYSEASSQPNHIQLAPASADLFLTSESSILYGMTTYNGCDYIVVEYNKMGYAHYPDDLESHQISVQVLIPMLITPCDPIRVHYGEVKGVLRGMYLSIGFTSPTHIKGRSLIYYVANRLNSYDNLFIFLGTGTNPTMEDSDCDSIQDSTELFLGLSPLQPDSDGDGLSDGWEVQYQYDALIHNAADNIHGNEKDADPDNDGLTNQEEEILKTNPHTADSDGDGVQDKAEVEHCSNPADASDNGLPMTAYPVTFTFGDWSASHSEKYYLTITPLTGNRGTSVSWVNQNYGEVETKTALLTSAVLYEVELKHASSNQHEPDLDYTLNMRMPNGCGYQHTATSENTFGEFDEYDWEETQKKFKILLLSGNIYCDINRDGIIQKETDGLILRTGKQILHHWSNDDYDVGNCSDEGSTTDIPKGNQSLFNFNDLNYRDDEVNGRADLLDFVPLWFDISNLSATYPIVDGYTYALTSDREVGLVFTNLSPESVFDWHISDETTYNDTGESSPSYNAPVYTINTRGLTLTASLLNHLNTGVLMLEGHSPGEGKLKLCISKDDILVAEISFQFKILEVEEMYRHANITTMPSLVPTPDVPQGLSDNYFTENAPYIFFLHGFNVSEDTARGWHAEMFKRLWQTGVDMKFVGVIWKGDEGALDAFHYHENVQNALLSGEPLAKLLAHYPKNNTKVIAHSLGNMVVCSALQFYNAECHTFMMLNAAIPSEAFGATLSEATNYMTCSESEKLFVPDSWHDYPCKTWSTHWHKLFAEGEKESKLTWCNVFKDIPVKTKLYNFYSSEDEVFELNASVPSMFSGTDIHLDWPSVDGIFPYIHLFDTVQIEAARYAWQKQEVFKGVGNLIGTKGGGWSFHCRERGIKVYPTGDDAQNATDEQLRTRPVFSTREAPFLSNVSQYSNEDYFTLLALHMPALTPAMGKPENATFSNIASFNPTDMITLKSEEWGREHFEYRTRWLHSDIKNMAYFYVYNLFRTLNSLVKEDN